MNVGSEAMWDEVDNPSCNVFGCGIKRENVVEIFVVEGLGDSVFDMGEVAHHTVDIQLLGFAVHGDNPVVPVHVAASAVVRQCELVASRNLKSLFYIIHK